MPEDRWKAMQARLNASNRNVTEKFATQTVLAVWLYVSTCGLNKPFEEWTDDELLSAIPMGAAAT